MGEEWIPKVKVGSFISRGRGENELGGQAKAIDKSCFGPSSSHGELAHYIG